MNHSILIVDEDEGRRRQLASAATRNGMRYFDVGDAFAGMAALGRADFTAVLAVEGRRRLSLRGLCQLAHRRHPDIRIFVLLREGSSPEDLRAALEVDHSALEPQTTENVLRAVRDALIGEGNTKVVRGAQAPVTTTEDASSTSDTPPVAVPAVASASGTDTPGMHAGSPAAAPSTTTSGATDLAFVAADEVLFSVGAAEVDLSEGGDVFAPSSAAPAPPPAADAPAASSPIVPGDARGGFGDDLPTTDVFASSAEAGEDAAALGANDANDVLSSFPDATGPDPFGEDAFAPPLDAATGLDADVDAHAGMWPAKEPLPAADLVASSEGDPLDPADVGAAEAGLDVVVDAPETGRDGVEVVIAFDAVEPPEHTAVGGASVPAMTLEETAALPTERDAASPTSSTSDASVVAGAVDEPPPDTRAAGDDDSWLALADAALAAPAPGVVPSPDPSASAPGSSDSTPSAPSTPSPAPSTASAAVETGSTDAPPPPMAIDAHLEDLEGGAGAALLMSLFSQGLTGRVFVDGGDAAGALYFHRGEPVWVDDPQGDVGLYRRMIARGVLAPQQRIESVPEGQLLGSLVQAGLLTGEAMHNFMRDLVRDRVIAFALQAEGSVRFVEDRSFLDVAPLLKVNPFGLVLESRRKRLLPPQLIVLGGEIEHQFLVPGPALRDADDKLAPFVRNARASELITGASTVKAFIDAVGLDVFMGTLLVATMRDARLVTIEQEPRSTQMALGERSFLHDNSGPFTVAGGALVPDATA